MTENELDSSIAKIVDYAKDKKQITWDELNELLDSDTIKDVEKMSKLPRAQNSLKLDILRLCIEKAGTI